MKPTQSIYKEQMELWLENAKKSLWLSKTVSDKKELIEKNRK